jgi:hypothetical protein
MSRGARWIIVAVLIVFSWMVLAGWATDTANQHLWDVGIAGFMLLLAVALIAPDRFRWALRIIAGVIGVGYFGYFATEAVSLLRGERQPLRLGQPSATMAGLGFLLYGIPALVYALGAERVGLARLFRARSGDSPALTDTGKPEPGDADEHADDR